MADRFSFCEVLQDLVTRSGHSIGQLSRITDIPKATIANWLQGRVRKPRNVKDLLELAAALHLDEVEASHLLEAAGHPPLERLRVTPDNGDYSQLLTAWSASTTGLASPPFQALPDLSYFVGRERELQMLEQALLRPKHQAIYILHGMAGVGKTTLATHLAYRLRPHFRDGVLWATLSRASPMSILLAFADALGHDVGGFTDLASRSAVVRDILADRCVLVVLDDADSSEEVYPLLPPSGPAAVLVTTRLRSLGTTWGAKRFWISAFDDEGMEAIALFTRIVGKERVQQEQAHFVEMAHLLGNLPLAIAVAGFRLAHQNDWATADFLARVRCEHQRLDQLTSEDASVRLSFNLSFEALDAQQQRLFAALGVLGGEDFSVEAAAHVAALPLQMTADLLRQLFNLSLVQPGRRDRYRLHPLLRDYARARAGPPVIDEAAFDRALSYFLSFLNAHKTDLDAVDLEIGNITDALTAAYERQMLPELVRGANALFPYLATRGLYTVAPIHLSHAIDAARRLGDTRSLITALHNQGQIERIRGNHEQAAVHLRESLALAGELNDKKSLSAIMSELVLVEHLRADYKKVKRYPGGPLDLVHSGNEPKRTSTILLGLGLFKLTRGNFGEAEAYLQTGLRLARAAADPVDSSSLFLALGMTAYRVGNYDRASGYVSEALSAAQEIGYGAVHAAALMGLGIVTARRGGYTAAKSYFAEGLSLSGAVGHSWAVGGLLSEWGNVCLEFEETEAAAIAFEKALDIAQETGARGLAGETLYGLARIALRREDLSQAMRFGQESVALLHEAKHYKAAEVDGWLDRLSRQETE